MHVVVVKSKLFILSVIMRRLCTLAASSSSLPLSSVDSLAHSTHSHSHPQSRTLALTHAHPYHDDDPLSLSLSLPILERAHTHTPKKQKIKRTRKTFFWVKLPVSGSTHARALFHPTGEWRWCACVSLFLTCCLFLILLQVREVWVGAGGTEGVESVSVLETPAKKCSSN